MCSLQSRERREDKKSFCLTVIRTWHHEYQSVWQAALDEELKCVREVGNRFDVFALPVVRYPALVSQASLARRTIIQHLLYISQNGGEKYAR